MATHGAGIVARPTGTVIDGALAPCSPPIPVFPGSPSPHRADVMPGDRGYYNSTDFTDCNKISGQEKELNVQLSYSNKLSRRIQNMQWHIQDLLSLILYFHIIVHILRERFFLLGRKLLRMH